MTNYRIARGWLLLPLTVICCGGAATVASAQQVHLEVIWESKGSSELGEFASITGMIEATPGVIWIADSRAQRVLTLTDDGASTALLARDGEGPGEVRAPGYLSRLSSGDVAVHNRESIEIFSPNGRFVRRVRLQASVDNIKGFAALPSGGFVISGGFIGSNYGIHHFGADGSLLNSWDSIPSTKNVRAGVLVAGGPVHALGDDRLLFSRAAPHDILLYNIDGKHVESIASDPKLLAAIGDDFIIETVERGQLVRRFRWLFPQSGAIFKLDGDTVLNVVLLQEQGSSLWEVYKAGKLITRTLFDRAYRPWSMTSSGGVLVSYLDPETGEPIAALIRLSLRS